MSDLKQVEADAIDAAHAEVLRGEYNSLRLVMIGGNAGDIATQKANIRRGLAIARSVRAAYIECIRED